MLRRIICSSLVFILLLTPTLTANATSPVEKNDMPSVEGILSTFHRRSQLAANSEIVAAAYGMNRAYSPSYDIDVIRQETVDLLTEVGYEAYNVTRDTFFSAEDALNTDLHTIGLSEDHSYIVVVSGESSDGPGTGASVVGTPSSSFTFVYNNVSYTMRYLTVTAADAPPYGMTSEVNLLRSTSQTLINNCLNTAIGMYLSSLWQPLGTVASLLDLDISHFSPNQTATINLAGSTNWTRVYTQVADSWLGGWTYGSCVEYVNAFCRIKGSRYDEDLNMYVDFVSDETRKTYYSDHYSDVIWRKEKAVFGATQYLVQYDHVSSVKYVYGGNVKITHQLNLP